MALTLSAPSQSGPQRPSGGSGPAPAQQPFTRRAHVIDDQLLPQHHPRKHHVDIRVLDALVRRLEGWHKVWVVLEIRELVSEAGVSQASVTRALARLEEAGVLMRRKKRTPRGRYVWELALGEAYRTATPGQGNSPSHVTMTCHGDMPMKEKEQRSPQQPDADPDRSLLEDPPTPRPDLAHPSPDSPESTWMCDDSDTKPETQPDGSLLGISPLPASAVAEPTGEKFRAPAARAPELSAEQTERLDQLTAHGVRATMAERLVRTFPLERIDRELGYLPQREGVRDPARYLVAAILDGDFAPPEPDEPRFTPPDRENAELAQERARQRKEREEQAERERQEQADRQAEESWSRLLALPAPERDDLIAAARSRMRGVAAQAPWDAPGPMRGALLNVFTERHAPDLVPRLNLPDPAPRFGGRTSGRRWDQLRRAFPDVQGHG